MKKWHRWRIWIARKMVQSWGLLFQGCMATDMKALNNSSRVRRPSSKSPFLCWREAMLSLIYCVLIMHFLRRLEGLPVIRLNRDALNSAVLLPAVAEWTTRGISCSDNPPFPHPSSGEDSHSQQHKGGSLSILSLEWKCFFKKYLFACRILLLYIPL